MPNAVGTAAIVSRLLTVVGREGRLHSRLAAAPLDRIEHRRLFAADVRAGPGVDVDLDGVVLPEGRLAKVALGACLFDGALEARLGEVQLVAHVDVRDVRADAVAGDDAALDARVRVLLHQRAVLVRAGLALVGVDDEIMGLRGGLGRGGLGHEAPLDAHRKPRAAAAADVRLLGLVDDLLARHRGEHAARLRVAAEVALVGGEAPALGLAVRLRQVVGALEHPVSSPADG
jgi:hypothetical protein